MITNLFDGAASPVKKVSVQVSERNEAQGTSEDGTFYVVEVLFPDGTWQPMGYHRDLKEARLAAQLEACARGADLLPRSLWPNGQITDEV